MTSTRVAGPGPPAPPAPPSRRPARPVYSREDDRRPTFDRRTRAVTPSRSRWVRWGWLASTIAMGAALVATAWIGRDRAAAAASTLDRGESQVLLQVVRQQMRNAAGAPDVARLDSLLVQYRPDGLRYLGVLDSTGAVAAEAGQLLGARPQLPRDLRPGPPVIQSLDRRVRIYAFVSARRPPAPPSGEPSAGPPPPRPRPDLVVIEFEPLASERLVAEATQSFALSAIVAIALLGAALFFWRLSVEQEETERRFEQQRRLGVLGEMSAVLAHEIRNPLASLKGHAQLLAERLAPGGAERAKAELVVREAQRLEALTGDLLDFARSGPVERTLADPVALVRDAVADVASDGFVVRADGAPAAWRLDAVRVRQALANVLRNARQASPEGSLPEVTVAREQGALVYAVRDFGAGIAPGDEKRVFSPFYTTRTTGTGLGLAVALRVAEMHGGTITAENPPGGGALFRLMFRD